jgi:hypothetical protein
LGCSGIRNWLKDIRRTGKSMRDIWRFMWGEGSKKLTGRREKTRGSYVGKNRDYSEVLF